MCILLLSSMFKASLHARGQNYALHDKCNNDNIIIMLEKL